MPCLYCKPTFLYQQNCGLGSLQSAARDLDRSSQGHGFPCGSDGKEYACSAGDLGLVTGLGRSPGGGHGDPLQYSCLENPHRQRCLVSYSPWGHKESDRSEQSEHSTVKGRALRVRCGGGLWDVFANANQEMASDRFKFRSDVICLMDDP